MKLILLLVLVLLLIGAPAYLFLSSTGTGISVKPAVAEIGLETPVHVHLVNPHGIRSVTVTVEQDGKSYSCAGD